MHHMTGLGVESAELLFRNERFLPRLLSDLDDPGVKSVLIHQFNWEDDGSGRQMIDRLKRLAQEGKDVRVMVDAWGFRERGWGEARRVEQELVGSGVQMQRSWPMVPGQGWEHRKVINIEFEAASPVTYLGGLGFGRKYDTWSDLMVRLRGPVADASALQSIATWRDLTGPVDARLGAQAVRHVEQLAHGARLRGDLPGATLGANAGAEQAQGGAALLTNQPGVRLAATEAFLQDARTAQRRLWVTSTYVTSPEAVDALSAASRRLAAQGSPNAVRMVVAGPTSGNDLNVIKLARTFYRQLLDAGVEITERPEMLHAKSWLADDTVTVGSMNLSHSSMTRAREVMARIDDPRLREEYESLHLALRRTADDPELSATVRDRIPAAVLDAPGRRVAPAELEGTGLRMLTWAREAAGLRW